MAIEPKIQHSLLTEYSFWLLPAEPLRAVLYSIIQELADTFTGVYFEPHVTISCGPSSNDESLALAREIASQFTPVELTPTGLDHTNLYTKTLFIQFEESASLREMSVHIRKHSSRPSSYLLNPHLSLLYKIAPLETRTKIGQTLRVPKGIYRFDRLKVIETEIPLTQPEQIKRWRTVFESKLS